MIIATITTKHDNNNNHNDNNNIHDTNNTCIYNTRDNASIINTY